MHPVLASALFGLAKAMVAEAPARSVGFGQAVVFGPMLEETIYREGMSRLGVPSSLGAISFAVDHLRGEHHDTGSAILRAADVFAGGLLYGQAYREAGLLGAIAAHAAHNLSVYAIQELKRKKRSSANTRVRNSSMARFAGAKTPRRRRSSR